MASHMRKFARRRNVEYNQRGTGIAVMLKTFKMSAPPLKQLGQYEILEELGRGGMSTVYRAHQPSMGREVAIKVLSADLARETGFMDRFIKEVQLIAQLEHPHILPVIDYGESDNAAYLVMRLVMGGSLGERIKQGPFSLEEVRRVLNQIASALDYAHRRGVIHRDLKPSNVLLDQDGNCYLTDFGIAKLLDADDGLTTTGHVMGTPAYMSPEQGLGLPIDGRADIYALGLILYEMLVRRRPFTADSPPALIFQHVYHPPPRPTVLVPELPRSIEKVVLKALAKRPEERYQRPLDLAEAFDYAISGDANHTTRLSRILATSAVPPVSAVSSPPGPAPLPGSARSEDMPTRTMTDSERQVPPLPGERAPEAEAQPAAGAERPHRRSRILALLGLVAIGVAVIAILVAGQFLLPGAAMSTTPTTVTPRARLTATETPFSPGDASTLTVEPTLAPTLTVTAAASSSATPVPPTPTPSPTGTPTASPTATASATATHTATPALAITPGAITSLEVFPVRETGVRAQPAPDAEELAIVNPGQRLNATGRSADGEWIWVRVAATGRKGWVRAADLNPPREALLGLPEQAP